MAHNNLTSRKNVELSQLNFFFEFLNKDISSLTESELTALLHTYTSFLCQFESSKHPFLTFQDKYELYTRALLKRRSEETLSKRTQDFVKLQSHLRSNLDAIIRASNRAENMSVLEMTGTRKVSIDIEQDSFVEAFSPQGLSSSSELDLATEKSLADLVFADMVQEANLRPSHFRRCERTKCGKFFYQPTEKDKNYCSEKCANADRQYEYRKKQEKEAAKGKTKKPAKRKQK